MKDYAKVMIEKKGLSSLQESINIGKQVLERKLAVYKKKVEKFEQARGMDNETFMISFNKGDLGDNKEWLEWDHVASVVNLLKKKLDDLENLKYEY
jgi:predicted chitinase